MNQGLPDPTLITYPAQLKKLAAELAKQPIIAVDTESNSLYAYQEQVCLIQFSADGHDYLVDPLAFDDLSILGTIFANPAVEKVFHAAEYDLICLQRDFDFKFTNLFDTMVAARTLGWKKVGLSSILAAELNVFVDKRYQRADWGKRPLPKDLLNYARLDTHYLIQIRHKMRTELEKTQRWALAHEDFIRACHVNITTPEPGEIEIWRVNGARDLNPQQAAVLKSLCEYRDQIALQQNRPLFKILGDHTLLGIALASPGNHQELTSIRGMNGRQLRRYGQGILNAVQKGLKAPPVRFPRRPRPNETYLARLETLKNWRKLVARKMRVDSGVVLPRDILYDIARVNPPDKAALADLMKEVPWRLAQFGDVIFEILQKIGVANHSP